MRINIWAVAVAAMASCALAQVASDIQVPVRGFVEAEEPPAARPIVGVAGGSVLGEGIGIPEGTRRLRLSPDQRYALVEQDGGLGVARVARQARSLGPIRLVRRAMAGAGLAAFSPAGSAAVLYSSQTQVWQVLTGLPGSPRVSQEHYLPPLGGPLAALAISDDADVVLGSVAGEPGGGVYLLGSRPVRVADAAAGMRFAPGTRWALLADQANSRVLRLEQGRDGFAARQIAGAEQGLSAPADVAISAEGRQAYVTNSGARNLLAIDLETGETSPVECDFIPEKIRNLGEAAFLVSAADGPGVWVLDTPRHGPRVSYLPPLGGR